MEDEKETEETPRRGNDWEVVSLTASAYAAAPGSEAFDSGNESVSEEDEVSRAMFMSGHFVFPPSQHENLPIEPIDNEIYTEPEPESEVIIDPNESEKLDEENLRQGENLPGHGEVFQTDISGSAVRNENLSIPEPNVSTESNSDSSSDSFKSLSPTKGNKSKGSRLPCDAWWKRQALSLYAQAKEANAFWSVFVAAALMGIVILGQRWQQEGWQSLQSNISNEAIADTPSFIFLWVGDGVGLEQGRQCLRKWGFRRCEDICWVKTNKSNSTSGLRHDSHTLFQHSKEHCLMGIKGTVRRSTDGHVIHANIDTDIVIAEEPPYGSTTKPEDLYRIIEHFSLGRRRIELFGEDHNIRSGWMTVGKDLSSSNFNAEAYIRNFCDKDGKVWQGGGGRNPPPGAPHLMVTTPEIEGLRPKSPPPKNQQQQQPTMSLTQTTTNSANRRPMANSPQTPTPPGINQEASSSHPSTPAQWASSPIVETKVPETPGMATDEKGFDGYGYEASGGQLNAGHLDFGSQGASNML